jgi:hypothetical protein
LLKVNLIKSETMLFSQIPILENNFLLKKALKIFRKKTKKRSKGYTFKCQTNQIREIKYQIIIINLYNLII